MKLLLTTVLLASFAGLALFGVFGMHWGVQNHDGDCVAATVQGTDCPRQDDLFAYLAFHLNALKSLSAATFNNLAISFLIFSLLVAGAVSGARQRYLAPPKFAYCRFKPSDPSGSLPQDGSLRWLALHENSPAHF